jgi:hypothetical protein
MHRLTPLLVAASIVATTLGCTSADRTPTAPSTASMVRASAGAVTSRPAGGRCTTAIGPAPTRAGYALSLHITGVCQLKHLGRATIVIEQDFAFDGSIVNVTTHTAANGDVLNSTWYSAPGESSSNGIDATFAGVETYVGGTGRFANVSGSSRVEGTAHLDVGEYTSEGTIVY